MKKFLKEALQLTIFSVVMGALMFCFIWYATSPEVWYANMHDSECESTLESAENCGCYDRFLEKEKAN